MTSALLTISEGRKCGRDPREMTGEELEACGVERRPVLDAIRAKCLDCCCGQRAEVAACVVTSCALWPYRQNSNPFRSAREMSDEQRAAAGDRLAKARAARASA